jgi:hypothetical protein
LPFTVDPLPLDVIETVINVLSEARENHRQVFVISAPQNSILADLFASDLVKFSPESGWNIFRLNPPVPDQVEALVQSTANNQTWRYFLLEDLPKLVRPHDVVVGISSGFIGEEISSSFDDAKQAEARTIAFSGRVRSRMGIQAEINLHIPGDNPEQVEDGLFVIELLICKALREMDNERITINSFEKSREHKISEKLAPTSEKLVDSPDLLNVTVSNRATAILDQLRFINHEMEGVFNQCSQLREVLGTTLKIFEADSGSILVFDAHGNPCEAAIAYGNQVNLYPADHLLDTLQRGLAGWVVEHREPALVADTRSDTRWLRRIWDETNGPRSAISVPMMKSDHLVGVLTLVHSGPNLFDEGDLMLLAAVSVQIPQQGISSNRS